MLSRGKVLEAVKKYSGKYTFYSDSLKIKNSNAFFIGKDNLKKYLFIIGESKILNQFHGEIIEKGKNNIKRSYLSYYNLLKLKSFFPYIWPTTCNKSKSFGTGDRLGLVTAPHIGAFKGKSIFPILAQQSVRELGRTERSWQDVINDAVWGYFEEGLKIPFGSDADHVKVREDLKKAVDAGFTMFTIDPSDYIQNISNSKKSEIREKYYSLNDLTNLERKYLDKNIKIGNSEFFIDQDVLIPIIVKYQKAIDHVSSLYWFLKEYKKDGFDFEVSMDEIDEPITPLEHYYIASELKDKGIDFQNLALRYAGRWEKAIDYIGDIRQFENELLQHVKVIKKIGDYKLSLHSGSEKFSTYKAFLELTEGNFHIKTAGTSWLEALRVLSKSSPVLFKEIFRFSLECFERDRNSYHLTTNTKNLPGISKMGKKDFSKYLDIREVRQIMHVTFGSVLTYRNGNEGFLFRDKVYSELFKNEDLHYEYVSLNIRKHLNLLNI